MGILIAHGAPFRAGSMLSGATLVGLAPTLLFLLGKPIPTGLDGRLLAGALTECWLQEYPPRFSDSGVDDSAGPGTILAPEVMARLRGLGYAE